MRPARILALAALSTACAIAGGEDSHNGTGDPANWTVTATFARPTLTVPHGGQDTVTVTVTRGGGYTGAIDFFVDSIPGFTAVLSNIQTSGLTTTALFTVGFGPGGLVFSTPYSVHANADKEGLHADPTITVNVVHNNGFWTTAPARLSVARGSASGPTRVTFTKTGFTDDVTMSLPLFNGAPAGITATFTPNPIAGDTVTSMTILVDTSVPEGSYSLGVRCNGGGYQGTAPLTLTVTAAAGLSMSFVTNPLIVARGAQNATFINLVRTNLTAGITPTITSTLPTAVAASFGPPTSFGLTVSLNFNVNIAAIPGTYTVNVTSGGVGVPVVTIPLTLMITP